MFLNLVFDGSLLIDSAESEEEAKEKIHLYEERSATSVSRGHSSYIYVQNNANWWN
jgi:hypothetical protein